MTEMQQQISMEHLSLKSQKLGPKVYKNHKIENKWATEYQKAMQDIVFGKQCLPYMPTEPPASLSEEIVESGPLYVCKQCKDCFRFQSSFEDHNTRHSWILGLWCHICFKTICTHVRETGSTRLQCSTCMKKSNDKRTYLRVRGLPKNQRMGAIKVFYNQCQFVEHMKMHQSSSVNMGDLMLMPLPINMSNSDWSSEFEILCEALMERAFLWRIHIIDFLKIHNLQNNWWKLYRGKSSDSIIAKIVESYQGRQLFEVFDKSTANVNFSSNVAHDATEIDAEFIDDNSMDKNSCSADIISDKNILENEDNPCTPTDITFVDCGPTSQYFEPEISMNTQSQMTTQEIENYHLANTVSVNNKLKNNDGNLHETDEDTITVRTGDNGSNKNLTKQSLKANIHQYKAVQSVVRKVAENNPSKTGVGKTLDNLVKIGIPFSARENTITKALNYSEQSLQTLRANSNTKILTIQDSKNIASIISQLPSHLISNKKVVVIGQDSCGIIAHNNKNEVTVKKGTSISIVDNSGTNSSTSTQKMCDFNVKKQEITGKIIIKDGKKYLIKRTKNITKDPSSSSLPVVRNATNATKQPTFDYNILKSSLISTNSSENENIGMEQTASVHSNVSFLTPSPSPSELSSGSSCESHVKKTSIVPKLQKGPPQLISISATYPTQKHTLETISLIEKENGDLYMDIKKVADNTNRNPKESFRDVGDLVTKYRQEMFNEFYEMNSLELKERIDHLQWVSEEMKQVLNFISDNVFKEKLRAISTLQCILIECLNKSKQNVQDTKSNDVIWNEWKKRVDLLHKCPTCFRTMKPKSYIAGFSKLPMHDNTYCLCYKHICHICLSYQGSTFRFITHQDFHRKSKPYTCPDCNFIFDSVASLEVHTWTVCFHTLRKLVFTCKICEIDGFRDIESITRHFVIMHSKTKVGCEDCFRVFYSYSEYVQHCTETHPSKIKRNPARLVICKLSNVILRCENYMSYLEKYSGIRRLIWFKCPFCPLITTDNKHVTKLLNTHMQNNHIDSLSTVLSKEAFNEIFSTKFLKNKQSYYEMPSRIPSFNMDNGTVVPKIVNTRTISSETFEHGSQDTEWSVNTNEVVNENLQTEKKIDAKEQTQLLPKIINVRSIGDLKSSKPKKTITKFSNEMEKKSNSPTLQVIIEDGKVDPYVHEETTMELDDNTSNNNEETAKTKEPDNNELNKSCVSESEKSLLGNTVDIRVNSPIILNKKVSNSEGSTSSRIKIIDFGKICKPDIEQFVTAEMCEVQSRVKNASFFNIPKPPPLVRIPQHLLEPVEANESKSEPANGSKKSSLTKTLVRRVTDESKVRIALGTDVQEEDSIDYLCHLCNERINTSRFVMQTHFREKHSDEYKVATITPQLSRMSPNFINGGYKQFINNKKRKSDNALFGTKRKRRWTPKKHIEMKDASVGLCVEQETAEDGDGNFICKKCSQRCTDMPDLREHIAANHRLKGRYLICLECGENFVVAPSLQMHLKAFHGIEDPISYMNQNPSYAPDDGDLQTEERTTVANQCHVCMAVFEDKAAVDKHLRVHGMAFLNRKRIEARNALEKKTNTEEDKPSIIKNDSKEPVKRDKPVETILEKINAAI